jgi:cystathionine beta-lyase
MGEAVNFDRPVDRGGTWSVKYDERAAKFGRGDVLPLWVADMDLPAPECVTEALKRRAAHPIYGYTLYPDRFYGAIAAWMRRRHGWRVEREWIVPLPGVVPGLELAVAAFTKPGEGVLVQPPVYHPFLRLGRNHGRKLLENPLRLEDSPHNPVGRAWEREELARMARICAEEGCLIVSDEVHADIVYPPAGHTPLASLGDGAARITLTFNSPGKTFNVAGLATAYAIVPDDTLRRRLRSELRRYDLTMGNLFGIEALVAAYEGGEAWLGELLEYLRGNIRFVTEYLARHIPQVRPLTPEATYLMWLDCSGLGMDDGALARFFVEKAKLGLNAGVSFGSGGSGFMRLNVACPRSTLEEAMERLKEAVERDG